MQSFDSPLPEKLVTIPARFDGNQIKLDLPYRLLPNARLLVTVLQPANSKLRVKPVADRAKAIADILSLEGIYEHNKDFDEAMELMDKLWKAWNPADLSLSA